MYGLRAVCLLRLLKIHRLYALRYKDGQMDRQIIQRLKTRKAPMPRCVTQHPAYIHIIPYPQILVAESRPFLAIIHHSSTTTTLPQPKKFCFNFFSISESSIFTLSRLRSFSKYYSVYLARSPFLCSKSCTRASLFMQSSYVRLYYKQLKTNLSFIIYYFLNE